MDKITAVAKFTRNSQCNLLEWSSLLKPAADCNAVPVQGELSTEDAVSVDDRLFSREPSLNTVTNIHIYTHIPAIHHINASALQQLHRSSSVNQQLSKQHMIYVIWISLKTLTGQWSCFKHHLISFLLSKCEVGLCSSTNVTYFSRIKYNLKIPNTVHI